jgi:hypothetical protein
LKANSQLLKMLPSLHPFLLFPFSSYSRLILSNFHAGPKIGYSFF